RGACRREQPCSQAFTDRREWLGCLCASVRSAQFFEHDARTGMALHHKFWLRALGLLAHAGGEAIAAARNGQNVPVLLGRIAERLAQDGNVLGYVGFLDKTVRPEGLHQLLFAYHAIAVLNQDQKRVEGLGHERDRLLPAQQEPLARIKPERTEP